MFVGLVCNVIGMNQWHFKVAIHGVTKNACLFDKIYIAIKILHKKARTKAQHVQAFNRLGFLLKLTQSAHRTSTLEQVCAL